MLKKRVNIAKKEKRIRDTRWGDRDSRQETKRLDGLVVSAGWLLAVADSRSWELGRGTTGDRRGGVSNSRSHMESQTGSKAAKQVGVQ